MLNINVRPLFVFSAALAIIFTFTAAASAQQKKAVKKTSSKAAKTTKTPPKLKTPATDTAKTPAKEKPAEAVTAKAEPEKKTITIVSERVWIPAITVDKIKADLTGKTVSNVPSEITGDGSADWQFSNNQTRQVEILGAKTTTNVSVVEARVSAKKSAANLDGSFDQLKGVARLHYERSKDKWELKRIENVDMRHSDTGATTPRTTASSKPQVQPEPTKPTPPVQLPPPPPVNIVASGATIPVAAGRYQSYSFNVSDRALVTGRFQAQGGPQNDIETYILDYDGFTNWINNHGAPAYYNSGRLTVGNIKTVLSAGTYYVVFNNKFSTADDKVVDASIQLRTDAAAFTSAGYNDPYNGAGLGTLNVVRRTYAPNANPAPQYTPGRDPNATAYTGEPVKGPDVPVRQVPVPTTTTVKPKISEVRGFSSEQVLTEIFDVSNRNFKAFPFTVKPGGVIRGSFSVTGGDERNIEAFIMTADQYSKWNSYLEAVTHYSSGRVTSGRMNRNLPAGSYYLVFSNYYSARGTKTVEANIQVEYEQ